MEFNCLKNFLLWKLWDFWCGSFGLLAAHPRIICFCISSSKKFLCIVWLATSLTNFVAGTVQAEGICTWQVWEATCYSFWQFKSMVGTVRRGNKKHQWETWKTRDFPCCNRFSLFQGTWLASNWLFSYGKHSHSTSWPQRGEHSHLICFMTSLSLIFKTHNMTDLKNIRLMDLHENRGSR